MALVGRATRARRTASNVTSLRACSTARARVAQGDVAGEALADRVVGQRRAAARAARGDDEIAREALVAGLRRRSRRVTRRPPGASTRLSGGSATSVDEGRRSATPTPVRVTNQRTPNMATCAVGKMSVCGPCFFPSPLASSGNHRREELRSCSTSSSACRGARRSRRALRGSRRRGAARAGSRSRCPG